VKRRVDDIKVTFLQLSLTPMGRQSWRLNGWNSAPFRFASAMHSAISFAGVTFQPPLV